MLLVELQDCRPLTDAQKFELGFDTDQQLYEWFIDNPRRIVPIPWRGNARFFRIPDNLVQVIWHPMVTPAL